MKETKIKIVPAKIEMTAEARTLSERVNNPQDLNDALLAVAVEEHAKRAIVGLNAKIKSMIVFGIPWK